MSTIYLWHWVGPKHQIKIHKALFLLHEWYVVLVKESWKITHLSVDKILNKFYMIPFFFHTYDRISNFVLTQTGSKVKMPSINFPAMEWTCMTAYLLVPALFLCVGASRWRTLWYNRIDRVMSLWHSECRATKFRPASSGIVRAGWGSGDTGPLQTPPLFTSLQQIVSEITRN